MSETTESTSSRDGEGSASFKQRVTREGKERMESGKRTAADQIGELADAIDVAGAKLNQSQPTLASYAANLAAGIGGVATRLREDSIEDLYHEARRIARDHPAMFLMGSAAVGLAIARFMKAEGGSDTSWQERDVGASASVPRPRETPDTQTPGI